MVGEAAGDGVVGGVIGDGSQCALVATMIEGAIGNYRWLTPSVIMVDV